MGNLYYAKLSRHTNALPVPHGTMSRRGRGQRIGDSALVIVLRRWSLCFFTLVAVASVANAVADDGTTTTPPPPPPPPRALTDPLVYNDVLPPRVFAAAAPSLKAFAMCQNKCPGDPFSDDELSAEQAKALDDVFEGASERVQGSERDFEHECFFDFAHEPSNLVEQLVARYMKPAIGVDTEARIVGAEYWFGDRRRREVGLYVHVVVVCSTTKHFCTSYTLNSVLTYSIA